MKQFEIVTTPIQTEPYREFTLNEHQGAMVMFTGHVREWTKGVKTEYLEYEAYIPMAEKKNGSNWPRNRRKVARNRHNYCSQNRSITNFRHSCFNCRIFSTS